jgi:hypothetical protein
VDLRIACGHIKNTKELLKLKAPSDMCLRAFARQLLTIGERIGEQQTFPWNPFQQEFNRMMAVHRDWFHKVEALWGKVGYVLVCQKKYPEAVKWLSDWQQRKDIEPWMLENLLLALQQTGRDNEAHALIQAARALPRHLGSLARFDLFDALHEACAGKPEAGQHLLSVIDQSQLDAYDKNLATFLRVALEFLSPDPSRMEFNHTHRKQLGRALDGMRRIRVVKKTFREVTDLIVRQTGKRWILLWRNTRLLFPLRPA